MSHDVLNELAILHHRITRILQTGLTNDTTELHGIANAMEICAANIKVFNNPTKIKE